MQKSKINLDGVDYVVRTINITSLPTFEGEAYMSVDVADVALWHELERKMEQGDKYAERLDEGIFFYPDSEFIKADPSDEELLDYLREHLCGMTRFKPVRHPEAFDLYAIEGREGEEKLIQLLGYTYKGDNWKVIDVKRISMPLSEFVEGMEQSEGYVDELYMASRQYERDVTDEECVTAINHYFDGDPADYRLRFEDVTLDTPVGNYVHESVVATALLKVGDKVLWNDFGRLSGDDRVFEVYEVCDDMVKIASGEPTDEGYSEAEVPIGEVTKLKEFCVTCTQIHNGYLHVQAGSAEEACAIASDRLDEVDWQFGEQTVDYANEVKNNK